MKQKLDRPTLSCRLESEKMQRLDQMLEEMGQSRSDWLYQLVSREMGEVDAQTVRSMSDRIAALEKKLTKLSLLIAA